MIGYVGLAFIQADPELLEQVRRLAWAQIVMAVLMGLTLLVFIAAGLFAIRLLRAAQSAVQPVIDTANLIKDDARKVSESVRDQVQALLDTVEDANRRLRAGVDSAEARVRDFGVVVDAVQGRTEDALLDTAATARGLQVAAEALRKPRPIDRPARPAARLSEPAEEDVDAPIAREELGG